MDDITSSRNAFREQLERMILERQLQLTPLLSGDMRVAYRLSVKGSEWVDSTDAQAQRLRTEIADMQAIADDLGPNRV